MIINMLYKWNHRYSSYNTNIKYIGSTIKYLNFERIHYAINLNVVSFSMVVNNFDFIVLLMYY